MGGRARFTRDILPSRLTSAGYYRGACEDPGSRSCVAARRVCAPVAVAMFITSVVSPSPDSRSPPHLPPTLLRCIGASCGCCDCDLASICTSRLRDSDISYVAGSTAIVGKLGEHL